MGDFIYRGRDEETALERLERAGLIAVDMETVSLNDYTAIGIGIYFGDSEGIYFPIFPEPSEHLPLALWKTADPEVTKIYHNGIGFDLEVLKRYGEAEGFNPPDDVNYEDTSIMAQVHGLPAGLQRLGEEWLGHDDLYGIQDLLKEYNAKSMLDVPLERTATKCLNDCRNTWEMYHYLKGRMNERQRDCYEVDRRLVHVLRQLEGRGLALRQGLLEDYRVRLNRDILSIKRQCEAEGFDPGSPLQVGFVLASRGNTLPFTDKTHKRLKTDEETLETVDDPLAKIVLDYRGKAKTLSSYVEPWIGKDRAYTHFRLDLATGRLASGRYNTWDSRNRNLQNVPPSLREVFRPDSGVWSWADHGQIELRVLAYISKDKAMMAEYYKDQLGEKPDLHKATMEAARKYVPTFTRDQGKTFNFARVFGAGDRQLSRKTGVPLDAVPIVRAAMASIFPESGMWIEGKMREAEYVEYEETIFGRRCRLPEAKENSEINPRAFAAHRSKCAVNYPVQGSAADIVKRGILKVYDSGVDLRLQVHDEYLVDGDWLELGMYVNHELAWIHPELNTPFEVKKGIIWS